MGDLIMNWNKTDILAGSFVSLSAGGAITPADAGRAGKDCAVNMDSDFHNG